MNWKTLDDMDLNGKRVLVRVDINVPVKNGIVTDATRIERIKPTIEDILKRGGTPMLIAHFGRPKGKVVLDLSLRVILPPSPVPGTIARSMLCSEANFLTIGEMIPRRSRSSG